MFSCEYCEIFKIIFFYITPPVAASVIVLYNLDEIECDGSSSKYFLLVNLISFRNRHILLLSPCAESKCIIFALPGWFSDVVTFFYNYNTCAFI